MRKSLSASLSASYACFMSGSACNIYQWFCVGSLLFQTVFQFKTVSHSGGFVEHDLKGSEKVLYKCLALDALVF